MDIKKIIGNDKNNQEVIIGIDVNPQLNLEQIKGLSELIYDFLLTQPGILSGGYDESVTIKSIVLRDLQSGDETHEFIADHDF